MVLTDKETLNNDIAAVPVEEFRCNEEFRRRNPPSLMPNLPSSRCCSW